MSKVKKGYVLKNVWNIVTTVLLIASILVVAALFVPRLFGVKPYAVISGSMEPTYHVGSLIYVGKASPESIEVGDPITFTLGDSDTIVTHRVIAIDEENQTFSTKGDNNKVPDGSPVTFANLIGKPLFTVPVLGYVSAYANTRQGLIIIVTAIVALLVLAFLPDLLMKDTKNKDNGKEKEDQNEKETE